MPLKIALVGAPSSGKTELAQQIHQALLPRSFQLVDDYVKALEDHTSLAFNHYANHLANVMVACKRIEDELHVDKVKNPDGGLDTLVTCGTIIETTVYSALFALANSKSGNVGINLQNDRRAMNAMTWLGNIAYDTWDYDYAFYLPYDGDEDWQDIVDKHIAEAAEALNVNLISLPEARDERIAKVIETIQDYKWEKDAEATATEE